MTHPNSTDYSHSNPQSFPISSLLYHSPPMHSEQFNPSLRRIPPSTVYHKPSRTTFPSYLPHYHSSIMSHYNHRLPGVESLLNMTQSTEYGRRQPDSSHHHHHHRSRSSRMEIDHPSTNIPRPRRPDSHPRPSSSLHRNPGRLPSVSEVLGAAPQPNHAPPSRHPQNRTHSQVPASSSGSHERNTSPTDGSSRLPSQRHPCERCGRTFTRKSDAAKHIRVVHDKLKVFACTVCGRRFARKDYCTVSFYCFYLSFFFHRSARF